MIDRRFTDAEKALGAIRERKFTDEEYKTGYINALDGLLLSVRSGDERDFYNKNNFDQKSLKAHREEFKEFRKTPIRTQFDSGYFAAWSDIMQYRFNVKKDLDPSERAHSVEQRPGQHPQEQESAHADLYRSVPLNIKQLRCYLGIANVQNGASHQCELALEPQA